MKTNRAISTLVAMTIMAVMLAFAGNAGASLILPADTTYRVTMDFSNADTLMSYTDMNTYSTTCVIPAYGDLLNEDGHLLYGNYRLWFLDSGAQPSGWDSQTPFIEGMQVVGFCETTDSDPYYSFSHPTAASKGLYGNMPRTPDQFDEGAVDGEQVYWVVAHNMDNNKVYKAHFTEGPLTYPDGLKGEHDITIIPEPATLGLLAMGAAMLVATKRRRRRA